MAARLGEREFRALLNWFMVSDPWPLDDESHRAIGALLESESGLRGFSSWVVAYHELPTGRVVNAESRFRTTLEEWAANNYDGALDADKTAPENVIHSKGLDAAIDSLDVPDLDGALEDHADDAEVFPALAWLLGRLMR